MRRNENCNNLYTPIFTKWYEGDQINQEMGGECSRQGKDEEYVQNLCREI